MTTIDQMGRSVNVPASPQRIVSIVPSQTELLFDLGLTTEVFGITKFCVHPKKWFKNKTRVGGTKNLDLEKIRSIKPDLIIGNKEENSKNDIISLEKDFPVWMSDVSTLKEAISMIRSVGSLTRRKDAAEKIASNIESSFKTLEINTDHRKKAVYLIWKDPYMVAGKNTFIDDMMSISGLENAVKVDRYPELTREEIEALNPDVLLLSSEPFPFQGKHANEVRDIFRNRDIIEVDGEMFSWYGSRLQHAPKYFHGQFGANDIE